MALATTKPPVPLTSHQRTGACQERPHTLFIACQSKQHSVQECRFLLFFQQLLWWRGGLKLPACRSALLLKMPSLILMVDGQAAKTGIEIVQAKLASCRLTRCRLLLLWRGGGNGLPSRAKESATEKLAHLEKNHPFFILFQLWALGRASSIQETVDCYLGYLRHP